MRFDRRLVGFGLFLVTVGIVMVAARQGHLPAETARRAWNLYANAASLSLDPAGPCAG